MDKKTSTKETPKKEAPTKSTPKPEVVKVEEAQPEQLQTSVSTDKPEPKKPTTLDDLQKIVDNITKTILEHRQQIAELQEVVTRKRKPTNNGKIQIKDKNTGKVYPSNNNCYQSLLKAGELKELVDKGVFGSDPTRNNFGWFALNRAWPDRFEEMRPDQSEEVKAEQPKDQA